MALPNRPNKFRRLYPILIEVGFVASLLLVIGAFRANYRTDTGLDLTSTPIEPIELVPIVPTNITPKPPPPPMPPVPVEVPNDEVLDDEPIDIDSEIHINETPPVPPPPPRVPTVDNSPGEIFVVVEDYPKPIGGMEGIMRRLQYPEIARKAGIEGRVTVQFVIEKDGTVSNPQVLKGIGGGCDEAAVKAIRDTRFTPGMQRKKPVRVRMSIPIVFKMN